MGLTPAEEFHDTAARFAVVVDALGDTDWDRASPVEGWTARDVVGHLVEWFPAFLRAGTGLELPVGPGVENDPAGAWHVLSTGVQALQDDPATADRVLSNPHIGEVPLADAVSRFFTADVFMHTWDLARATGQDDSLDAHRCATYLDAMLPLDDVLRASGQYGPKVEVGPDSDPQTRLIAFIGRDPAWTSA
ncbi:MAG: TIGR03086 family protein [Microthrixaceae bacterium]|nr:TIGR03086 family protein [Microthrixaceae bacterium]